MSQVNPSVFEKFRIPQKLPLREEADGHALNVDVREDEEQHIKLEEIINLLVAAGYFRARIKGLSPFDKVVGGMTWCIESCNVDVDVDLLFQENLTIGQKIALTEKIVIVLPKMKCPHVIEPHQIQGLDFIHIFPVIQWLVKRSMEFRQEMAEFVRSYAINQYKKHFGLNKELAKMQANVIKNVCAVKEYYKPHRSYKRKNNTLSDLNVQITLLEYGYKGRDSVNTPHEPSTHESILELPKSKQELFEPEDLNENDLKDLANHYASLQLEFKDGGSKSREQRQLILVNDRIDKFSRECTNLASQQNLLEEALKTCTAEFEEIKSKQNQVNNKLNELEAAETSKSESNIKEVEELVMLNDDLKAQEAQFRDYCKKELVKLQTKIEEAKNSKSPVDDSQENSKLTEQLSEKIKLLRLELAKKNRTVSTLRRSIDDVPNRPELAQYQRRFLELYNQVSAKHSETKQYYNLYNTLEDSRLYMKKELSLLNSISDSYTEIVQFDSNKDEFLKQFQKIVEGVKQSNEKTQRKLSEEKRKRDQLSSVLQNLIEQQRKYVTAVRQLRIECKRHETLSYQQNF